MPSVVQISCLGSMGRFGNCLFQYAFARAIAEKYSAVLQTPKWVGQELFSLNDPPIEGHYPTCEFDDIPEHGNVNLHGYFQNQRHIDYLSHSSLKKWFAFKDKWTEKFPVTIPIAAHIRRGDYLISNAYCIVSEKSYVKACKEHGYKAEEIMWVREENAQPADLPPELVFLRDFFTLKNASVLFRANSTFSWWASVLGDGITYSPVVGRRTGLHTVKFVKGNHSGLINGLDLFLPV